MGKRSGLPLLSAVAAGLYLAAVIPGHHGHKGSLLSDAAIPAGGGYTPQTFAVAFLRADGKPVTRCNVAFVRAWEAHEGGNWSNQAARNPLNSKRQVPGSWNALRNGVKGYPSWQAGMRATLATIRNGDYTAIQDSLAAGNDAQRSADAVARSPWGTNPFPATC